MGEFAIEDIRRLADKISRDLMIADMNGKDPDEVYTEDYIKMALVFMGCIETKLKLPTPVVKCFGKNVSNNPLRVEYKTTPEVMYGYEDICYYPIFTDREEIVEGLMSSVVEKISFETLLKKACDDPDSDGIIINPFGKSVIIPKSYIEDFFKDFGE